MKRPGQVLPCALLMVGAVALLVAPTPFIKAGSNIARRIRISHTHYDAPPVGHSSWRADAVSASVVAVTSQPKPAVSASDDASSEPMRRASARVAVVAQSSEAHSPLAPHADAMTNGDSLAAEHDTPTASRISSITQAERNAEASLGIYAQQPRPPILAVSPGGRLSLAFYLDREADNTPMFTVSNPRGVVILPSAMRLSGDGASQWFRDVRIVFVDSTQPSMSTWPNVLGERSTVPDNYNEVVVGLARSASAIRTTDASELHLIIRAYDEGVAFRFVVPDGATGDAIRGHPRHESIEFNLPPDTYSYWTRSAQKTYARMRLTDWAHPCEAPLTLEYSDGQWVSLLEAAQVNFPRMRYARGSALDGIVTQLHEPFIIDRVPFAMPWRVIMVADKPGQLLEHNYLVLNLNPPNALADTSWIKPGRVMRSMSLRTLPLLEQIDFAVERNIEYVHLDAGWYGNEYDPASDATKWNASIVDLPRVISYAKWKKRGIILYVNHLALERQIDELFPLYRKWGVDGVKFGFVNVGPQNWTVWLHDAIRKAAEHKLVVDVHDDYRPTGFSRTYPHLLQVEGIYGDEGMPSANQSTIYPFTRFLAGHADHTYCFMDVHMTKTKAHQLALTVINFGPLQFLSWYDSPAGYKSKLDEIEFWADLPTVWDDTKVVDAVPGEYVAIARRSGASWWVGIVTNESARRLTLSLGFLEGGAGDGRYDVRVYEDANEKTIGKRSIPMSAGGVGLAFSLRESGGVALQFRSRVGK